MTKPVLKRLDRSYAQQAAKLHSLCFEKAWPASDFEKSADMPTDLLLGHVYNDKLISLIQLRTAGDHSEIITICTHPEHREKGLSHALIAEAVAQLSDEITTLILEVAEDNKSAIALYQKCGFTASSRRKGYYRRGEGKDAHRVDAVIYSKRLSLPD